MVIKDNQTTSSADDPDVSDLHDNELNFLGSYSSSKMSYILFKATVTPLVTLLSVYSWLPLFFLGIDNLDMSVGIGLAITATILVLDVFSKGILFKTGQILKHSRPARVNMRAHLNFEYIEDIQLSKAALRKKARNILLFHGILSYIVLVFFSDPVLK